MPTDHLGDGDLVSQTSFIIRQEPISFTPQATATLFDIVRHAFHLAQVGQTRKAYNLHMSPVGQGTSDPVGLSVEATIDDDAPGLLFTSVNVFARETVAHDWHASRDYVARTLELFGGDHGAALDLRIKDNPFCTLSTRPSNGPYGQTQSPSDVYRALRDGGASWYTGIKAVLHQAISDLRRIPPPLEQTFAENNFIWCASEINRREADNVAQVLTELGIAYTARDGIFTVHPQQSSYTATRTAQAKAYQKATELGFGINLTSYTPSFGGHANLWEGYTSEEPMRRTRDLGITLEHTDIPTAITPAKVAHVQQYVTGQFGALHFGGVPWVIDRHTVSKLPSEMERRPGNIARIVTV